MTIVQQFEEAIGWPIDTFIRHYDKRLFETAMAMGQIAVGMLLLFSPSSVGTSGMRYLTAYVDPALVTLSFLTVGCVRMAALTLNGHWMPGGAYARSIGSAAGALLWIIWATSFYQISVVENTPLAPLIALLLILVFFEAVSMYRALLGLGTKNGVYSD